MAYLTYIASVPEEQVAAATHDPQRGLKPHLVSVVSHLIGYWLTLQPLGTLLGEAVDGGTRLSHDLWHPLRPPVYQPPYRVVSLYEELSEAWAEATSAQPVPEH